MCQHFFAFPQPTQYLAVPFQRRLAQVLLTSTLWRQEVLLAVGVARNYGKAATAFAPKGGGRHISRMKFRGCVISARKTRSENRSPATNMSVPENAMTRTDSNMASP